MSELAVATSRSELAVARRALPGTVALVPTMGALHRGHLTLLERAVAEADHVVVSIFVNPLQFAPGEDLDRYPRTLGADLEMCAEAGVSVVFAPTRDVVYPAEPVVRISAGDLGSRFEGASRPGHFDGVLTVVAKLFGLVGPDIAIFGRKDIQQLALVRRMVTDLDMPVAVIGAPIAREPDGLALSSRNRYLSPDERLAAGALSKGLATGISLAVAGSRTADVLAAVRAVLDATPGVDTDYVALVTEADFQDVDALGPVAANVPTVLAVAARVGTTRLIDNMSPDDAPMPAPPVALPGSGSIPSRPKEDPCC